MKYHCKSESWCNTKPMKRL